MKAVEVGGYKFNEGTIFLGNFMSTHMDEEYWDEPENFKPERFLCADVEKTLSETSNFTPFSIGKRACLGETLARVELFLFFTSIFKNFSFSLPKHNPIPSPDNYKMYITKFPDAFYCSVMERQ